MTDSVIKKIFTVLICAAVIISCGALFPFSAADTAPEESGAGPGIGSISAIIINSDSGLMLYGRNTDSQIYCGFLSRLMTCIMLVESGVDLDSEIRITSAMLNAAPEKILTQNEKGNTVYVFREGSKVSLRDLMKSALVANSQEAAAAIALTLNKDMTDFVINMNTKAVQLGAKDTRFVNATGYFEGTSTSQKTTVKDIATITAYAVSLNYIQEYSDKSYIDISVSGKRQRLYTKNSSVDANSQYYNRKSTGLAISGNSASGYTLSTVAMKSATKNTPAINFICVAYNMSSVGELYSDVASMVSYALTEYSPRTLVGANVPVTEIPIRLGKQEWVTLYASEKISASLPSSVDTKGDIEVIYSVPNYITAPVKKGEIYGTVTYVYNGEVLGSTELCAVSDVDLDSVAVYTEKIGQLFRNTTFIACLVLFAVAVTGYSVLVYVKNKQKIKENKRKNRTRVHPTISAKK